jgi:CheY-like chemotaxis protein
VVDVGEVRFHDLLDFIERTFRHVAEAKRVDFDIQVDPAVARSIFTDSKRLHQVIKNLLSNAFKFTERGHVSLKVEAAHGGWSPELESLNRAPSVLAISVSDTGIGISPDKQQIIFEAFQQADGSTSRKYGGTGLGLAISREIARLLGGEIRLLSAPGQGSTFTLFLPQIYVAPKTFRTATESEIVSVMSDVDAVRSSEPMLPTSDVADDRNDLAPDDRVLLIVDNDENFARFLLDMAHENGFKALVATHGPEAITLAQSHRVDAITLDIQLPAIDGWRVLDRLKSDLDTRHIPVYVITTEEDTGRGSASGALGVLTKPIKTKETLDEVFTSLKGYLERTVKDLLVVWPEDAERAEIIGLLTHSDVKIRTVPSVFDALRALDEQTFDCIVVGTSTREESDLRVLPELIRQAGVRAIPVVARQGPADLSFLTEAGLATLLHAPHVHEVQSTQRLLDQVSLFLHRRVADLPEEKRTMIETLYSTEGVLAGKKVLIVDDDIRNIFAMTSVLEREHMRVLAAETGKEAIEKLQFTDGIDIVLMDIMMPDMDGYDTMRAIRRIGRFKGLPIIAVTAKAMKGDREKTLSAGAWDYLAKPVDTEQMLSVLRAWLYR